MILDTLENAAIYADLNTGLSKGFDFLNQPNVAELDDGKYEIADDRIFAIVQRCEGRTVSEGKLEGHRKYIDIQFVISGEESMGWTPRSTLSPSDHYDAEKDLEFFDGAPASIMKVPVGSFAVFSPNDAHLPLIGKGPIHKVVVKVAVD